MKGEGKDGGGGNTAGFHLLSPIVLLSCESIESASDVGPCAKRDLSTHEWCLGVGDRGAASQRVFQGQPELPAVGSGCDITGHRKALSPGVLLMKPQ